MTKKPKTFLHLWSEHPLCY